MRRVYITEDETITTNGTKVFNLDFTDPLRELAIGLTGTRFDSNDTSRPSLFHDIDKIEIVDGSDVIYSTTGTEALAVQLYHTGKMPFMAMTNVAVSHANLSQLRILFGRDVSDNLYGLDLTRLTNPQLKITYSFAESAGYWAAGTQRLTVIAKVAEGASKPSHFLMTKEIYTWTKATSGDETIDLPRDYPYRFIMLQATDCATPVYAEFTQIKISCNYDEFVPLDMKVEDIAHDNWNHYGMLMQQIETVGDGSDATIHAWGVFAWNWGGDVQSWGAGDECAVVNVYSHYTTVCKSDGVALTAGQRCIFTGQGWEFMDTEVIRFGNLMDPEEYFDPKAWKSLRLILTQAQTEVASSIVVQQVRPN